MSVKSMLLVLGMSLVVVLVGCREPAGLDNNDAHTATVQTESCYVTANIQTGHFDWYQGEGSISGTYSWYWGDPITRGYYCYPRDPDRAYPRKNGYCVFTVPHFTIQSGIPACTLFYYQTDHSGSADLLVTAWEPYACWPPAETTYDEDFWAIWDDVDTDTVATDVAHTVDDAWYKVPLTAAACSAIAETAAAHQDYGLFYTGWVYTGTVDGTYSDVRGYDGYDNHPPFIKVVYDDGQ